MGSRESKAAVDGELALEGTRGDIARTLRARARGAEHQIRTPQAQRHARRRAALDEGAGGVLMWSIAEAFRAYGYAQRPPLSSGGVGRAPRPGQARKRRGRSTTHLLSANTGTREPRNSLCGGWVCTCKKCRNTVELNTYICT